MMIARSGESVSAPAFELREEAPVANDRRRSGAKHDSVARRLGRALLTPWHLSNADKCMCVALVVIPIMGVYLMWERRFLEHPDLAPYLDQPFLAWAYHAHGAMVATWVGVLALALVLRPRFPESQLPVYALTQFYAVGFSLTSYWLGHHTGTYLGTVLLGGLVVGFLLFEPTPVLLAIASGLAIIIGTTIAEQMQLIPYAPLLAFSPVTEHRLATSWLASYAGINFAVFLVVGAIVYHVCYRLRDRENELERMTDQLSHANALIRRYVPSQLAEKIINGEYEEAAQAERAKLTIFFSDIVGFTEIAEHMEPEDLSRVLNEYFSEMTAIAERHRGTVDELAGDAILVLFGAPHATDDKDHALRAVRMALDMQAAIETLNAAWRDRGIDLTLRVRIGIDTGVVTIGNFGSPDRMKYAALGKHVNLAARLQAHCEAGKILLSHATWLLVHDAVPWTPKGEVQLKGIHRPVMAYEVAPSSEHVSSAV